MKNGGRRRRARQRQPAVFGSAVPVDARAVCTGRHTAALLAGNDMLCCTDFETQIPAVLRAVEDGTISEARIDESVLRILRWKLERGIITAQTE